MLNIERYITSVMESANLARKDDKRVRGELECHLQEMLQAGERYGLSETEVMNMIEKEFGNPQELGKMIAGAKGRFRTYLKKQARKLPMTIGMAIILAFAIRAVAFEAFRVTTDAVVPVVPKSSRVLVNKLAKNFEVNDVIVFRTDKSTMIGVVKEVDRDKEGVIVGRKDREDMFVERDKITGKAVFLYSFSL